MGATVVINDYSVTAATGVEQAGSFTAAGPGWVSLAYEVIDPANGGATMARLEWATPDVPQRRVIRALEDFPGISERAILRYQSPPAATGADHKFRLQSRFGSFKFDTLSFSNDATDSRAIDGGDLASAYANETAPNGGRINLGSEGNTARASRSSSQLLQLLSFIGGEKVRQNQASLIRWRSSGVGTVNIWFSDSSGAAWTLLASNEVNDGVYAWNPASYTLHGRLRISDSSVTDFTSPTAVFDVSKADFTVGALGNIYYVNDGLTSGDQYSTAIGNNNNTGTTPADPMASLNAVLNAYDLNPGDLVYVDTGYYPLTTNVRVTAQDSGVTIQGPTNSATLNASYSQVVLADAPYLYYRLGETSGTTANDTSGNNRSGAFVNGVQLGLPGALLHNANSSIRLDGVNDYVSMPAGFNSFPNGFTFEMWVYPTAVVNSERFFDIGNGPASDNLLLYRRSTTNDLAFNVDNGASPGTEIIASNVIELNRWQYFAVTQDAAGNARIYKNGVQVGGGQTNVPNNIARANAFLGHSNTAADPYFAGGLDEAAFYDHALAPDRVAARYGSASGTGALLDRGNTASGRYAIELAGAQNVTLRNLSMTGGEWGFVANASTGLVIADSRSFNNAAGGVYCVNEL